MPMDRKTLKKRMAEKREKERARVKMIQYPLPDLRGPGGNAYALLGQARALISKAGLSESVQTEFHADATSGDYDHLLETLQRWFTVCVTDVTYVPLDGDEDILRFKPGSEVESWDEYDEPLTGEKEIDQALTDFEQGVEEQEAAQEQEVAVTEWLRQQMGLGPEDTVLVKVIRKKD